MEVPLEPSLKKPKVEAVPISKEMERQSLTAWDHHRREDGINGSLVKDHWGG